VVGRSTVSGQGWQAIGGAYATGMETGHEANLEIDLVARYMERMTTSERG
jgi:hypothetical protein